MTTLLQILGWIEHCEREHKGCGTIIPTWLCSMEAFQEAVYGGYVEKIGEQPLIPRWGMTQAVYGLTEKGRRRFYDDLPRADRIEAIEARKMR